MILLKNLKIYIHIQNNSVGNPSMMSNAIKSFDILVISLSVLQYNYFDSLTKLFSYLYLAKILDL